MWLWLVATALAGSPDLNTASAATLSALPGLGPDQARAIVEHREDFGPFESLAAVAAVEGVGAGTIAALRGRVTVRPPDAASTAPSPGRPLVAINTADADALATLPGIGPNEATAIVADRLKHGPFTSCADLARVPGLGAATVAVVAERCTP